MPAREKRYPDQGQHGRVVHALGTRIVSGQLSPGDSLPTEEALVGELGVGRSALREAVKVLAGKGLVQARTRAGTRVRPREAWHLMDPDVLTWRYQTDPSIDDLEQLAGLRIVLEPGAARMAAERASTRDVLQIIDAYEEMRRTAKEPDTFVEADLSFHDAIMRASGNELLTHLNGTVGVALGDARRIHTHDPSRYRRTIPHHGRVLDAIKDGDPDGAETLMRELVQGARRDLLAYAGSSSGRRAARRATRATPRSSTRTTTTRKEAR